RTRPSPMATRRRRRPWEWRAAADPGAASVRRGRSRGRPGRAAPPGGTGPPASPPPFPPSPIVCTTGRRCEHPIAVIAPRAARSGEELGAVVLAAGLGTRMRSARAKVLHELGGKPLLEWPLAAVRALGAARTVVVVGHQADEVRRVAEACGLAGLD